MSTDDLTARARKRAAHWPMTETSALLIELADEVDRLRAEADRWKARSVTAGTDLDAARAALERVRALTDRWDEEAGDLVPPLPPAAAYDLQRDHIDQVRTALEGKP